MLPTPWSRETPSAVEISFEFPPPDAPIDDDEDMDFYVQVLSEMRARRHSEEAQRRNKQKKSLDAYLSSNSPSCTSSGADNDMTESTASISNNSSSMLSWASSSHVSQEDESRYWRDRRQGIARVPQLKRATSAPLPDLLAKLSNPFQPNNSMSILDASFQSTNSRQQQQQQEMDYGDYTESVRQLQYSIEDLQFLAYGENKDFYKLQKSLRKEGAITNELLKQVLPIVVVQSQQRRKSKQRMAEQQRQQALAQILEMEPDAQAKQEQAKQQQQQQQQNNRAKSPIHKAFSFLIEEKKEEQA